MTKGFGPMTNNFPKEYRNVVVLAINFIDILFDD